jgi:NAD(P)-dependent dehydrogenase (short-subunit alcohol dehydrogenase family)
VLVNNAGYGHLGFFEETSDQDVMAQYATNVFGLFTVTRAILPIMRAARSGRISISPQWPACAAPSSHRCIAPANSRSKDSRNLWRVKWRRSGSL